jgi:hypothetical protein
LIWPRSSSGTMLGVKMPRKRGPFAGDVAIGWLT